ncbi:ESX secretion-associated protein EspG [Amycolatopsis palatopharyngis]|uniref:ESX secretion-associated protein EspG n=1 Tax=Amycolatopsis palatopharyngis TaxID=187982 RepID=UPI000E260E7E|nr:ESX secretion-associated protein EspG [Amycolatopsis palatopharyngis]
MRDETSGWIQLHVGEFSLLWTELGLGELPAILRVPRIGRLPAEREELVEAAGRALAERGLGTVRDPAGDLADLLYGLADPRVRLDLHTEGETFSFAAFGSVNRQGAVSAGVAGTEVRLGPVRTPNLVATMLEILPPLPAAVGSGANVRVDDYLAACAAGEREGTTAFAGVLRAAGLRPPEVNAFSRALTGRVAGGQLGGSARARDGRWQRATTVLGWVDTEDGRYALQRKADWVTATPVDGPRLRAMGEQLLADLPG